jgi:heme exporter protein D
MDTLIFGLGMLGGLIPLAVGVFFIWVALRVVDELHEIRKQLWEISRQLSRASAVD